MIRLPFGAIIVTASERQQIADDFMEAAKALEDSASLNWGFLEDQQRLVGKLNELSSIVIQQAENATQIMAVNEILAETIAKIREECDAEREAIDEIVEGMSARLMEFDSGS